MQSRWVPVDIEGVLQLLREGLHLGALLQQLPAQAVHLVLQDINVGYAVLQDVQLPPGLPQLQLQQPQLVQPVDRTEKKIIQPVNTREKEICTSRRSSLSLWTETRTGSATCLQHVSGNRKLWMSTLH